MGGLQRERKNAGCRIALIRIRIQIQNGRSVPLDYGSGSCSVLPRLNRCQQSICSKYYCFLFACRYMYTSHRSHKTLEIMFFFITFLLFVDGRIRIRNNLFGSGSLKISTVHLESTWAQRDCSTHRVPVPSSERGPPSPPRKRVCLPRNPKGEQQSLTDEGVGGANSDEWKERPVAISILCSTG